MSPAPSAHARQSCQPPPAVPATPGVNLFNDAQENDLGDIVAERFQRSYRVIDDEDYTTYLRRIGARLLKHVPPTGIHFQFFLFDLPTANAFTLPGGRIYVSRKLVAFTRSEDELASVLAHEIGHMVVREPAMSASYAMRQVLGVTQVTNRQDIFDKFNQLLDNAARKPKAFSVLERVEEKGQHTADQLGLYAMASAGYDPRAFIQFWDRYAETKGKTGGFLSDLFGFTKPESRRLRELLTSMSAMPSSCFDARAVGPVEEFQKWQSSVVAYTGLGHKEALHAVLAKKTLDPPLQSDITTIKFSPDGKYLLAQNDSSVYVLSHQPFAILFRFDAPDAQPAQFTPDSQSIVVYDAGLHVEVWNVADEQRTAAYELFVSKGCLQTAISPDGKLLACLNNEYSLSLIDVATDTSVFLKKEFYRPITFADYFRVLLLQILGDDNPHYVRMGFSPDAKVFLCSANSDNAIAVDVTTFANIPLHGALKATISGGFTFLSPGRIAGVNTSNPDKSGIVEFPSGDLIVDLSIGRQELAAPGHGDYLLLRPIKDYPVGVVDLKTKKIFMANKRSAALDFYDNEFVGERITGELALYTPGVELPRARVALPRGSLGTLRAGVISSDLHWLAVSERTRGGVWDLQKGESVFRVRGFRGAYFSGDSKIFADFPKFEKTERGIALLDLTQRQVSAGFTIEESRLTQYGQYLALTKPAKKDGGFSENVILEVRDATTNKPLWTRPFPKEAPIIRIRPEDGTMTLVWDATDSGARYEIQNNPGLARRFGALKPDKNDYFVEVLDARNGSFRGGVFLDTGKGSYRVTSTYAVGDWLVAADNQNRTQLYSISTGESKGKLFGRGPALGQASGLLCVESDRGHLNLYDVASLQKRDEFIFASPVSMVQFAADGKRLFVLTGNQNAYILDVSGLAGASSAAKP
jgi:hypothetical protein